MAFLTINKRESLIDNLDLYSATCAKSGRIKGKD